MILHKSLPQYPWMVPPLARLPGVQPLTGDFLAKDEVFAAQMALRDQLIAQKPDAVHGLLPAAQMAARELYDLVLDKLAQDAAYQVSAGRVVRPDSRTIVLNPDQPLLTLGQLVQEDLCILQPDGTSHMLTGAILCFPASWTLAQKLGRDMGRIHGPVNSYTTDMAARVQRMMQQLRVGQGLWRMNYLTYAVPDLHHPRREETPRDTSAAIAKPYLRSERQCLIRLPKTHAVVFSIHTYVMRIVDLPEDARLALMQNEISATESHSGGV